MQKRIIKAINAINYNFDMDIIGYHKPAATIAGLNLKWMDEILQDIGAFGFILAFVLLVYRWIPLAFFALIFHVAFLYDKEFTEPYRFTMQAFPFSLFSAILIVRHVLVWGVE